MQIKSRLTKTTYTFYAWGNLFVSIDDGQPGQCLEGGSCTQRCGGGAAIPCDRDDMEALEYQARRWYRQRLKGLKECAKNLDESIDIVASSWLY